MMLRRRPSNAAEKEQGNKKKLQRSSSFKDFMKKPTSPLQERELSFEEALPEAGQAEEAGKGGGKLGKKWRNVITRTMTRKTSKIVRKALAEEGGDSGDESLPDGIPDFNSGQRTSVCSSGSEDTLLSPLYRQLSCSGDRQSLDSGYSQRDSMRLEESYNGPFCGRALVHTDFTPSPYDMDSLKLQKGDIISIIEKPPAGTWTGKLNNRVGSFKFIYVNILPDDSPPVRRRQCSRQKQGKSKPQTLEELLDNIGLSELSPLLSMHGFQNLEDFAALMESDLNELNITNPEQRAKILNATEQLRESEEELEPEEDQQQGDKSSEDSKEPRDSGCFESTEHLESGREESKEEEEVKEFEGRFQASNDRVSPEAEEDQDPAEELEANITEQLECVQEQLQELTVEEGS